MDTEDKRGTNKHPECKEGEIFISNEVPENVHHFLHFKTLRVGEIAYNITGTVADGFVPLLVSEEEYNQSKKA